MGGKQTEACGRCSMTTVLDATERNGADATRLQRIFGDRYIELPESQLRAISQHHIAVAGLKERLDDVGMSMTFGRQR